MSMSSPCIERIFVLVAPDGSKSHGRLCVSQPVLQEGGEYRCLTVLELDATSRQSPTSGYDAVQALLLALAGGFYELADDARARGLKFEEDYQTSDLERVARALLPGI